MPLVTVRRMLRGLRSAGTRQRSQSLVEYALIAACIAFVGMVGLNALSAAQKSYFTGLPLNPPAPSAPGALLHDVTVDQPVCTLSVPIGTPMTCNPPVVHDTYRDSQGGTNDEKPPLGTLTVHWDNNPLNDFACKLVPLTASSSSLDPACLPGSHLTWTPTDPALTAAPHNISFWYGYGEGQVSGYPPLPDPGSNHVPAKSKSLSITFLAQVDFNFACKNMLQSTWPGFQVEVGRPLLCSLRVTDKVTGNPINPADPGVLVTVSAGSGPGFPYFSCFTNDDPTNAAQHSTAASTMLAVDPRFAPIAPPAPTPGCQPQKGQPFSCIVVANMDGVCTNNYSKTPTSYCPWVVPAAIAPGNQPACSFVFRRNYDDNGVGDFPSTDYLSAQAPSLGQVSLPPTRWPITIVNSAVSAPTATVLQCDPSVAIISPPGQVYARGNGTAFPFSPINTDIKVTANTHSPLVIACTAAVIDINPNTAFDYPLCVPSGSGPPINCDIDDEEPHAPLGQVNFIQYDSAHLNPTPHTCALGHISPATAPTYAWHPLGAWFHASWCQVVMTFPVGPPSYVDVSYPGNSEHASDTTPGSLQAPELEVDAN